jgi:hypothetical protein
MYLSNEGTSLKTLANGWTLTFENMVQVVVPVSGKQADDEADIWFNRRF